MNDQLQSHNLITLMMTVCQSPTFDFLRLPRATYKILAVFINVMYH